MKDALTSLDQYGHRIEIIPAEVKGFFRRWRTVSQWFLILIFLVLPWTEIHGNPTILLDIVHRRFALFGVRFWAHDGPLIFFLFAIGFLSIALLTALWGRVWCGWGCPQTVFIDAIYRRIERWVEGNYIQRRQLRQAQMSFSKGLKWILKWLMFSVVSSVIAHSFVAYFVGGSELLQMIKGGPAESWNYFLLVLGMTGILLFNFGWFREQFCIVMCPYGRFQSVLMDANSITVLYDEKRGEPRKGSISPSGAIGDCVSCRRCVEVCPTGIDIRKGVQMECIACTACMDACDEIMTKVKKPKGLIRYSSLFPKARLWRPRIVIYGLLWLASLAGLAANMATRSSFMAVLLRATETPYQVLADPVEAKVLNHFKLHLHNQRDQKQKFDLSMPAADAAKGIRMTLPPDLLEVSPLSDRDIHFFVMAPRSAFVGTGKLNLSVTLRGSLETEPMVLSMILVGPE